MTDYTEFADSIRAKAAGRPVGIIFIDTLNRAMLGLEENSAKDTAKVIQACLFLKKVFRCTVVVVHHTPKDGSDPRGSSALYAGFDTVLKVIADKAVKLVRMFVTKQKTDEERAYPFCYEGKKVGPGLAFVPIEAKEAALLSDEANIYSPQSISKTLKEMKAFEPVSVSSHALLRSLVPQLENETEAARNDSLVRAAKGLQAAVKSKETGWLSSGDRQGAAVVPAVALALKPSVLGLLGAPRGAWRQCARGPACCPWLRASPSSRRSVPASGACAPLAENADRWCKEREFERVGTETLDLDIAVGGEVTNVPAEVRHQHPVKELFLGLRFFCHKVLHRSGRTPTVRI
jgi:hypothetical protein